MERNEISQHEVRIFSLLSSQPDKWFTNSQIAELISMPTRTVRFHTLRFVKLGILDQAEVFPAHRYRWAEKADKRNVSYVQRLKQAEKVFA